MQEWIYKADESLRYSLEALSAIRENLEWCYEPQSENHRYVLRFWCQNTRCDVRIIALGNDNKTASIDGERVTWQGGVKHWQGRLGKGEHTVELECGAHQGIYVSIEAKGGKKIEN